MREIFLQVTLSTLNLLGMLTIYTVCSALVGFLLGYATIDEFTASDTALVAGFLGLFFGLLVAGKEDA